MKKTITYAFSAALCLTCADHAHAYLDPGSGSMYLQIALGGLAGLGICIKIFWAKILTTLGIAKKDGNNGSEASK